MALVDFEATLKNLDRDLDLFRAISTIYLEDAPTLASELIQHAHTGDTVNCSAVLHKLKGLVANFHAEDVIKQIASIEQVAKQREMLEAAELYDIARQVNSIGDEIRMFLQSNGQPVA